MKQPELANWTRTENFDEFCIQNDGLLVKNDKFSIKTHDFWYVV